VSADARNDSLVSQDIRGVSAVSVIYVTLPIP